MAGQQLALLSSKTHHVLIFAVISATLLKIKYQHVHLLLLSITLRLPGPVLPILEEAERSALETLRIVRSFQIVSLQHVSNPVVTAIA